MIVPEIKDCYTALGVVHNLWQPIPKEFDDYISRPKGNLYQSLHTAVLGPAGKTLEVQIRTDEMPRHAEYGVAAHWRYKEKTKTSKQFEQKIAWLRELLAWRDEVADWSKTRSARLDDTVYVLTPQGKVIDLPEGATPVDFAYALHSDLGHRCRGAKVDGHMVPLDTARERPARRNRRGEVRRALARLAQPERGFVKSHAPGRRSASGSTPRRMPTPWPPAGRGSRRSCAAKARSTPASTSSPRSSASRRPTISSPPWRATK